MKRVTAIVAILSLGMILFGCSGYGAREDVLPTEAVIAVLETSDTVASSGIRFFDNNLKETGFKSIDYAGYGAFWQLSQVVEGKLYAVPKGLQGKKDEEKVLAVDYSDLTTDKYTIERTNIYTVTASEDAVYACSNLNFVTYLSRYDKGSGEVKEEELPMAYISSLVLCEDRVCAFVNDLSVEPSTSSLYVYTLDLDLVSRIDLSVCGGGQYRPRANGNQVVFASWTDAAGLSIGSKVLGLYDVLSGELQTVEFGNDILDALPYKDGYLILFGNIHGASTGGSYTTVAFYRPDKDGEYALSEEFDLGCYAEQEMVVGDLLYVVDDEKTLRTFDLEDGFAPLGVAKIEARSNSPEYTYISGMVALH